MLTFKLKGKGEGGMACAAPSPCFAMDYNNNLKSILNTAHDHVDAWGIICTTYRAKQSMVKVSVHREKFNRGFVSLNLNLSKFGLNLISIGNI